MAGVADHVVEGAEAVAVLLGGAGRGAGPKASANGRSTSAPGKTVPSAVAAVPGPVRGRTRTG
ncbi:hypothetical protein, partial [Streptomyces sp. st115]|uniref:hypothetical protein n=1 Tax=Streptomyces sp. st115 TaxID=1828047 RepID=UPI001C54EEBF